MDTNTTVEIISTLLGIGALLAPVAVLMERTHRRTRREQGTRSSWGPMGTDVDTRRISDEIHLLDGAAHR